MLGEIASGKSHVARLLASSFGATVVDADALAGQALERAAADGSLDRAVGPGTVRPDGTPDRAAIAARVFADDAALDRLEALLHPAVLTAIEARVARHRRDDAGPAGEGPVPFLLVLDVPLLLERGLDRLCDVLWFVAVPEDVRRARAASRGLDDAELRRRERRQWPSSEKRARAHFVLHNDRPLEPQIRTGLSRIARLSDPATRDPF